MSVEPALEHWPSRWDHGVVPLPQSLSYARAVRSLTESVLALDAPSPELDALVEQITALDTALRASASVTAQPRVGEHADDPGRRPFIDHSIYLGAFNPAFPEYTVEQLSPEHAAGTVFFSPVYEGPPGYVHGGFLAVFFDVVTGHQSSQVGVAGKTKSLEVRYRRPTPLGVTLRFTIDREVEGREVVSAASLYDAETLLCTARACNVAGDTASLLRVGERIPRP